MLSVSVAGGKIAREEGVAAEERAEQLHLRR